MPVGSPPRPAPRGRPSAGAARRAGAGSGSGGRHHGAVRELRRGTGAGRRLHASGAPGATAAHPGGSVVAATVSWHDRRPHGPVARAGEIGRRAVSAALSAPQPPLRARRLRGARGAASGAARTARPASVASARAGGAIARRPRAKTAASSCSCQPEFTAVPSASSSNASCSAIGVRAQLAAVDRLADVLRQQARPSASSARRPRRGPGRGARPSRPWRRRRSSRRRRRRARCSPARRAASSTAARGRARAPRSAATITRWVKIAAAARTVETCSSSLEPKCANRPLLLIFSSVARRPIESPSSPSTEATFTAACEDRAAGLVALDLAAVGNNAARRTRLR